MPQTLRHSLYIDSDTHRPYTRGPLHTPDYLQSQSEIRRLPNSKTQLSFHPWQFVFLHLSSNCFSKVAGCGEASTERFVCLSFALSLLGVQDQGLPLLWWQRDFGEPRQVTGIQLPEARFAPPCCACLGSHKERHMYGERIR